MTQDGISTVDTIRFLRNTENYRKALGQVRFTVYILKDGRTSIKLGKKADVAIAPDKKTAEAFAETLNLNLTHEEGRIESVLAHIGARCQQLNLFTD